MLLGIHLAAIAAWIGSLFLLLWALMPALTGLPREFRLMTWQRLLKQWFWLGWIWLLIMFITAVLLDTSLNGWISILIGSMSFIHLLAHLFPTQSLKRACIAVNWREANNQLLRSVILLCLNTLLGLGHLGLLLLLKTS
ncbi:hypothetical protein SAMN05421831_10484 [Allopseudospirillum japonicum]|uniref:Copper resistance protein D n=2 Tax=Allopseudospirillum japonicum TaxID=64971 RepID=A0A1H6RX70_9GAMM|nr:hypothetical protein SAMN05421831_10484 [Allopseudospirillum japonicum]